MDLANRIILSIKNHPKAFSAGAILITIFILIYFMSPGPYMPASPNPANNSVGIDTQTPLSWEGGTPKSLGLFIISLINRNMQTPQVTYNIYIGNNIYDLSYIDSIKKEGGGNRERIVYNPPNIRANATYYWRIIAINELSKESKGKMWKFATEEPPIIEYFVSDNDELGEDTSVKLRWSVKNADKIILQPLGKIVSGDGSEIVSPSKTTVYTLIASNDVGERRVDVTVRVEEEPPIIEYFVSDNDELGEHASAKLRWSVKNADNIILQPLGRIVSGDGSEIVSPSKTTVYTLIASNDVGERRVDVTINVDGPIAYIDDIDPHQPKTGQQVVLRGRASSNVPIRTYQWESNDTILYSGRVPSCSVIFNTPGDYAIIFTVIDEHGNRGTASRIITVFPSQ